MVIGLIKLLHTIQILMQYRWNTLWNHPENWLYFPMQKREKMFPNTSSVVISPVMLPR